MLLKKKQFHVFSSYNYQFANTFLKFAFSCLRTRLNSSIKFGEFHFLHVRSMIYFFSFNWLTINFSINWSNIWCLHPEINRFVSCEENVTHASDPNFLLWVLGSSPHSVAKTNTKFSSAEQFYRICVKWKVLNSFSAIKEY